MLPRYMYDDLECVAHDSQGSGGTIRRDEFREAMERLNASAPPLVSDVLFDEVRKAEPVYELYMLSFARQTSPLCDWS